MITDVKNSPFLHFLKVSENRYAVYNSLHLKKIFCDKETLQRIKKLKITKKDYLYKYLYKNRYIIDSKSNSEDEINYLVKKENINFEKPEFKVFYFIITTGCNFKCKYCYLSSLVDPKARAMNIETAKKALNYFYTYIKKVKNEIPKVVLYGGEPLLNKNIVKFIITEIREKIKSKKIPFVNIILITNGSLLDEEVTKFLKKNKVLVAISLDGPKKVNDSNRIFKTGNGTYKEIIKAINLLKQYKINPTISCTINEKNVEKLPEIIFWMKKRFQINTLGLNLFAGGDCSNKIIKKLSKNSAKKIIESFKICRRHGIYEDTIIRQMKAFVNEKPNMYYCAATGREIAVDPDGNLATCPAFLNTELFPLNILKKPKLETNQEFKKWTKRSPLFDKSCYDCIALGVCGGGCAFNSYKNSNDIYFKDKFYCEYAKSVTKWMLKDLYEITKRKK